jgi:hypothetical protein
MIENKVLEFDEFIGESSAGASRNQNMILYWEKEGIFYESLSENDFYKKFQEKNPELDRKITDYISKGIDCSAEMHEAYKKMRSYGASNEDLMIVE